jgi:hypothetical protein
MRFLRRRTQRHGRAPCPLNWGISDRAHCPDHRACPGCFPRSVPLLDRAGFTRPFARRTRARHRAFRVDRCCRCGCRARPNRGMTLPSVLATCPIRASNPASFASYVAPPSIGPRPTSAEHLIRKAAVASHLCAPALPQTAAPVDPRPPAPSSLDLDPHLRRVAHAACFGPYSHRSPTRDCAGNEYFATTGSWDELVREAHAYVSRSQ